MADSDQRLIEAGFPCHQVGAETQRERGASSALPPLYYLHVWWARRPLTPSRAAILASLEPADADPEAFVRRLGIERVQAMVNGQPWTLTGKFLERVQRRDGQEVLPVDAVVLRGLGAEQRLRAENRNMIAAFKSKDMDLEHNDILRYWMSPCWNLGPPKMNY
jgi:putative DNA methylase